MNTWFEGSEELACTLQDVADAVEDIGAYFVLTTRHMPGLSSVELVEQGSDFVTIRTNEGLMKRTNISKTITPEGVTVAYDEEYKAGSMITTSSHVLDTFTPRDAGVAHHIVISGVEAPGVLGFFYRNLGSSSIGKALLASQRAHLEARGA